MKEESLVEIAKLKNYIIYSADLQKIGTETII